MSFFLQPLSNELPVHVRYRYRDLGGRSAHVPPMQWYVVYLIGAIQEKARR